MSIKEDGRGKKKEEFRTDGTLSETESSFFFHEPQALVYGMFSIGAIRFGDFRWTYHNEYPNGPLAPMYFEIRMVRRDVGLRNSPVGILENEIEKLDFDMIADVPTAITPTIALLVERLGVGMVSPRKERKGKGSGALVDGFLQEDIGKTVLLVDDVLARGDSKLILADNLKKEGAMVKDVVVLMDYEIGGRSILEKNGYNVHSVFTAKQVLDWLNLSGKIDEKEYNRALERLYEIRIFFEKIDEAS